MFLDVLHGVDIDAAQKHVATVRGWYNEKLKEKMMKEGGVCMHRERERIR